MQHSGWACGPVAPSHPDDRRDGWIKAESRRMQRTTAFLFHGTKTPCHHCVKLYFQMLCYKESKCAMTQVSCAAWVFNRDRGHARGVQLHRNCIPASCMALDAINRKRKQSVRQAARSSRKSPAIRGSAVQVRLGHHDSGAQACAGHPVRRQMAPRTQRRPASLQKMS